MIGDHRLRSDVHAVDHAAVRHRRARSDVGRNARRGVQDAAVLHVGALTDDDGGEVCPQHRVEPDGCARLDVNVTDQGGRRCDERGWVDDRRSSLERVQRHHLHIPQVDALPLRVRVEKL